MKIQAEQTTHAKSPAGNVSRQTLCCAAISSTLCGALYLAGLSGKLIVDGSLHSTSSPAVQTLSAAIALLWNVSLLILFAALRRQVGKDSRFLAELALLFMLLACATSSTNWMIQLTLVQRIAGSDAPVLLQLLDVHSGLSISYALEHLGWGLFYGIAALFAGAAIAGSKLAKWIRWLFLAGGILSLVHFLGVIASNAVLSDLGYVAWALLLPASTALLAVMFGAQAAAMQVTPQP